MPRRESDDWYKDAILYELHVRSFQDSTADGIGDFPGLTSRLGYLQDLGVSALWLLPFYPSPLRDDGYDIANYFDVHPHYGTLADFDRFLDEAHRRGLRVFTELVINHTSDQHPWFQRARHAPPGSPERDFYVWSDTPERYADTRIIFQDFERSNWHWDPAAGAFYWHRFYSHQPDLNYRNPQVLAAILEVLDFWFGRGVDGMRLDAVPYLLEEEGTTSENLPPTHDVLKTIRRYVDGRFPGRAFLAEANQWPEDAVAYFGRGDESHLVFHFPLMPRLFMSLRQEDRLPIVDILAQTPTPPGGGQWALFLRNHDELTLEMVTEEERLYMYDVYASDPAARINLGIRRRLAPLLDNDRRRIELMNALLFSLPGTPILYYGDEIGMGDNIYLGDRNGVRTPMQWNANRNAGFSDADPQRLFLPLIVSERFHHQTNNVAAQESSRHSLLHWMRRLIAIRRLHPVFGRGDMTMVQCSNRALLAFTRCWRDERILVVANLSRFVQHATLDLSAHESLVPIELFGRGRLPAISAAPYPVLLAPHAVMWFELTDPQHLQGNGPDWRQTLLNADRNWTELLRQPRRADLQVALARYVERSLGTYSRHRPVLGAVCVDVLAIEAGDETPTCAALVRADYATGEPQTFLMCLTGLAPDRADAAPRGVAPIAQVRTETAVRVLTDVLQTPQAVAALLASAARDDGLRGELGTVRLALQDTLPAGALDAEARPIATERPSANAVFALGDEYVVKVYRHVEVGAHPEVEIGRFLGQRRCPVAARFVGAIEYGWRSPTGQQQATLGVIHAQVANSGEAWRTSIAAARTFFERMAGASAPPAPLRSIVGSLLDVAPDASGAGPGGEAMDEHLRFVTRVAQRVAELHRTLASERTDPAFAPEPFNAFARRSMYQRIRNLIVSTFEQLERLKAAYPDTRREQISTLLLGREALLTRVAPLIGCRSAGQRIRCHGNLHLGQLLHAGADLAIVDFDGEPGRPIFERRLKRSPLQDVVSLVRSFAYAAAVALEGSAGALPPRAAEWAMVWRYRVATHFLAEYRCAMADSGLLPEGAESWHTLFMAAWVERAVHELSVELDERQRDWIGIPLGDLLDVIDH